MKLPALFSAAAAFCWLPRQQPLLRMARARTLRVVTTNVKLVAIRGRFRRAQKPEMAAFIASAPMPAKSLLRPARDGFCRDHLAIG